MRILVTGAKGRVGSILCRTLLDRGHEVVAISRSGFPSYSYGEKFIPLIADLRNPFECPYEIDVIVHAAATNPPAPVLEYVRDNVVATAKVVDIARKSKVKALIYLSSVSVYGRVDAKVVDEFTDMTSPDAYGVSKYLGELLFFDALKEIPVLSLRLPGIVGTLASDRPWLQSVVYAAIRNNVINIRNPFALFNNAIHVEALSSFISDIVGQRWDGCEVVTLGVDNPMRIISIVELILKATASMSNVVITDGPSPFTISSARAIQKFGYTPQAMPDLIDVIVNQASSLYAEDLILKSKQGNSWLNQ